jgi:hypothetical protein
MKKFPIVLIIVTITLIMVLISGVGLATTNIVVLQIEGMS